MILLIFIIVSFHAQFFFVLKILNLILKILIMKLHMKMLIKNNNISKKSIN